MYTLLPSTVRMYRAFESTQALQRTDDHGLEQYVLSTGRRVYQSYLRHSSEVPSDRLCEVTFDELTQDGVGTMEKIYRQLELGDFAPARDSVAEYVRSRRSYQRNQYDFPAQQRLEIENVWKDYFDHFGYPHHSV